jgi:hypothetical protein
MRALVVSVEYGDLLAVTLNYNRAHFDEVWVVTSFADVETQQAARAEGAKVVLTDSFYDDGAHFNKWKGLEYGLDVMGRWGWLCLLDGDVCWPKTAAVDERQLVIGKLYGCHRHMDERFALPYKVPAEESWRLLAIHRNLNEFAGFTQIFHSTDPVLGSPPWHEIRWKHAGSADSIFQNKWRLEDKIRLGWNCLHIGGAGANWFGRASPRLDGVVPADKAEKEEKTRRLWEGRRRAGWNPLDPQPDEIIKKS